MAGDPAFCELLLAMGLRSFSMHPSQIVAVKQRVLAADSRCWSAWLPRILSADDPERECAVAMSAIGSADARQPAGIDPAAAAAAAHR
jgi:phosphotransferase system enzyme I (PtsI)